MTEKRVRGRGPVPIGIGHGKVPFPPEFYFSHRKVEFPAVLSWKSPVSGGQRHPVEVRTLRSFAELHLSSAPRGVLPLTAVLTSENVLGSSGMTDACVCTCNMLLIIRVDWIFSTNYTGYEVSPFFGLTSGSQNTVKAYF